MEDDLRRVGAVDGDRRVKALGRFLNYRLRREQGDGRGGQRLRGRLRFLREGEGGEDGILLGARDHDGVCDLEGLSAQFAFRRLVGVGQRVGNGVTVFVELIIVICDRIIFFLSVCSFACCHGVAEDRCGTIHRPLVSVMFKIVPGEEPPSAAAVVNVADIVNKPAVPRRIAAGEAVELLYVERVVVLLEYAALRVGIAVAFTRFAELPRDVVFCKGVVPPEHAQTHSALDGNIVAGERAVAHVGHAVAVERHVGITFVRAILPSFLVLTVFVVFACSDKVDSGGTEGYRLRVDPAEQRRGNGPHTPNLHPDTDTVFLDVRDLDPAAISVFLCLPCFRQKNGDIVFAGLCNLVDLCFQFIVDIFDCFKIRQFDVIAVFRNREGGDTVGSQGFVFYRAAGLENPVAPMPFHQFVAALAEHLGSTGISLILRIRLGDLSAIRNYLQTKWADLFGDRIHLIRGQRNPVIVAAAKVFQPPEADRDMQRAGLVLRPAHSGPRQQIVFAVDELADAHETDPFFALDLDREPDRLAIFQLLPGPFPVRRQCGGQEAQQQDEAQQ